MGGIFLLGSQKVLIDADLAELYGVPTKALNQAVKRNLGRFPPDFMFRLDDLEKGEVVTNCDHLKKLRFSKTPPHAFSEYGAIQAANILGSPQAVEMSVHIVRVFVQLRNLAVSNAAMGLRLDELERKAELLDLNHATFERDARLQLARIFQALRELMTEPASVTKRPIGFVTPDDKAAGRP